MDDINTLPSPADDAAFEVQVDHYIAEMKRLQQQMAEDREVILRLQAETRLILDDVMLILRAA